MLTGFKLGHVYHENFSGVCWEINHIESSPPLPGGTLYINNVSVFDIF